MTFATIDIQPIDDEWNSGEEIPVVLIDNDANKNSRADEDLDLNVNGTDLIPSLQTGDPFTLGDGVSATAMFTGVLTASLAGTHNTLATADGVWTASVFNRTSINFPIDLFSQRGLFFNNTAVETASVGAPNGERTFNATVIDMNTTFNELKKSIGDTRSNAASDRLHGFNFLNIDVRSFTSGTVDVYILNNTLSLNGITADALTNSANNDAIMIANDVKAQSLTNINATAITRIIVR